MMVDLGYEDAYKASVDLVIKGWVWRFLGNGKRLLTLETRVCITKGLAFGGLGLWNKRIYFGDHSAQNKD